MAYNKVLSGAGIDVENDLRATMRFLIEKFDATQVRNPFQNNLIILDKKIWWVVPSANLTEVDISQGNVCAKSKLISELERLQSGLLIFRQMIDNSICIYLITDIEKLENSCDENLILKWNTVERIKLFSELGIVFGEEVIGFKKLRSLRKKSTTKKLPFQEMF